MSNIKRSVGAGLAIAAAVAVGVIGYGGSAGASTNTTTESFLIAGKDGDSSVVAHGAFAAGGMDIQRQSSDVLRFGNGKLIIKHPQAQSHFSYDLDPTTCFATVTGTGSYTLANGTGAYANVTGSGTYEYFAQSVLAKNADGSCNDNAEPKIEVYYVKASGPVSVPAAG